MRANTIDPSPEDNTVMSSPTPAARELLAVVAFGLTVLTVLTGCNGPGAGSPSSGMAPDFTLNALSGERVTLSQHFGKKVVLLDFWSTTCDPCLQEMPELNRLYQEKKGDGLLILAISTDGPETAAQVPQVVSQKQMSFPVLLDEESAVMAKYNPKGELPFTVVINKQGSIVLKRASYQPGDEASWRSLVTAIDGALAEP